MFGNSSGEHMLTIRLYCHDLIKLSIKINFVLSLFGVVGSFLSVLTIRKTKEFSEEPCFLCFHAIAFSEFIIAICRITWYAFSELELGTNYYWSYWAHIFSPYVLDIVCSYSNIIMVTFLSFQRFMACTFTHTFYFMRSRRLNVAVIFASFLITLPSCVPPFFLYYIAKDNITSTYTYIAYDVHQEAIYFKIIDVWRILQMIFTFIGSALAILGLVKASWHR